MRRAWIRSTLFNIAFFLANVFYCIVLLPTLLLPRKFYVVGVQIYNYTLAAIEHLVLGLKFEVIGKEHIPTDGPYLVAAKHMSAYETFKLRILFNDPVIILKQELLKIPLWGAHLKKTGIIALDRSTPERALKSLEEGAIDMTKNQGRPIVIFPQGTRVKPEETTGKKPYKAGIYRIQQATNLPIIPMATNSGLFWPRSGWLKSSGTVTFKFLPQVEPGMEKRALMNTLEEKIESESLSLMNKAKMENLEKKSKLWIVFLILIPLIAGLYSYAWIESSKAVKQAYIEFVSDVARTTRINEPRVSGFPGPIKLDVIGETIETNDFLLDIKVIHAEGWPIPLLPITVRTGPISISRVQWREPLEFEGIKAKFSTDGNIIDVKAATLKQNAFEATLSGTVDLSQKPVPKIQSFLSLKGYGDFIGSLAKKDIIEDRIAMFTTFGFSNLADENGVVSVALKQKDNKIYAGPLPIIDLPELFVQEELPDDLPPLESYNQLGPDQ